MGVGQSFAFVGLVATIVLQGVFSGGLSKPQWILTFSAFLHTIRLFGCNPGAVFMGHFLAQREKLHSSNLLGLHVQRGTWITDTNLRQLKAGLFAKSLGTTLAQPITQLIKIHANNKIAASEVDSAANCRKETAELQIPSESENLNENDQQVRNLSQLEVARVESSANLLEAKQTLLATDIEISDLTIQLNDVLGLPLNTQLALDPNLDVALVVPPREESVKAALCNNPEIQQAVEAVARLHTPRNTYPRLRHSYQNGVPFVDRDFGTFGIDLSYDVFDAGKRKALLRERRDEVAEAEENLQRVQDEVVARVEMIYPD
ncbi:MAG TPA: TolC family protein [Terriglobales bacterium]|nr:TolC family protein [Terriglobales bacterium]